MTTNGIRSYSAGRAVTRTRNPRVYADAHTKNYDFKEETERQFIRYLLSTGQLTLAPSAFETPEIISELRRAAGSTKTSKPPYKIKLGSDNAAEIARSAYLLHDFIDAEGIAVPRYMGGPSKKAIPLVVATAMEIAKYDKSDRFFLFNEKTDDRTFSMEKKLEEMGVTVLDGVEMTGQLSVHGVKGFAAQNAAKIRAREEYFDAVVGEGVYGLAGAVAILKTLYDENHVSGPRSKKLAYEKARTAVIEHTTTRNVYDVKGVERGDNVFLVSGNRNARDVYGDIENADVVLAIDDSAVSYRSMKRYLESLRRINPKIRVSDIIELVSIEELDWTKEGFESYLSETWKIKEPKKALHILTTSKRIFEHLHESGMTRGQVPLVNDVTLESAKAYFREIEDMAKQCPDWIKYHS